MKAVAVPYVIALILGVIIIVLLGYWIVAQGGKATNTGLTAECEAKFFSYCAQWQANDRTCSIGDLQPVFPSGCSLPSGIDIKAKCKSLGLCT